ncbi:MAG TPA: response regulator, partial [Labilithrix sp.]|nr:response regulator [Labilithrix sp.]
RERILVVDDNADGAEMLRDALALLGHDVRVAHDGPTALEVASRFEPRIALLDIGLPVMDGYELAAALRQRLRNGPLRLIAITGYGQEEDQRRSAAAGFELHLIKPIDLAKLAHVVERERNAAKARSDLEERSDVR